MWRTLITNVMEYDSINKGSRITLHLLHWKFYTDNGHRMRWFVKDFASCNTPHNFRADNNRYQITETISLLLTAFKHYGTFFFITGLFVFIFCFNGRQEKQSLLPSKWQLLGYGSHTST